MSFSLTQRPRRSSPSRDAVLAVVHELGSRLEADAASPRLGKLAAGLWLNLAQASLLPTLRDAGVEPRARVRAALERIDALRDHAHGPLPQQVQDIEALLGGDSALRRVD
jgi:hypothetical protein